MMTEKNYPIDATLNDVVEKKMPDTARNERYRVEVEVAADMVSARKRRDALQRAQAANPRLTNIMLTKSLRELEADGLVERRELISDPPKLLSIR